MREGGSALLSTCQVARRSERRGRGCELRAHAVAVGAERRLRCDARARVAPRNSLRSLRSLRSDSRGEVSPRSALTRADPGTALLAATQIAHSPHPLPRSPPVRSSREATSVLQRRVRAAARGPVRRRAAQELRPARVSALRGLTCRRLSERSERSERSELGGGPRLRAAQGNRPEGSIAEVAHAQRPARAFAAPPPPTTNRATSPPSPVAPGTHSSR